MMDMNSERDFLFAFANDIVATWVLKALHELKILVPENISVLGFDNVQEASFTSPSLSTIDVPKFELGKISVKVLFDLIRKSHKSQLKVQVPFSQGRERILCMSNLCGKKIIQNWHNICLSIRFIVFI